jgi:hypothetical protein
MLGVQGLWVRRDLYRAIPAVTQDLGFSDLIRRTSPFLKSPFTPHEGMWRIYSNLNPHGVLTNCKMRLRERSFGCDRKNWGPMSQHVWLDKGSSLPQKVWSTNIIMENHSDDVPVVFSTHLELAWRQNIKLFVFLSMFYDLLIPKRRHLRLSGKPNVCIYSFNLVALKMLNYCFNVLHLFQVWQGPEVEPTPGIMWFGKDLPACSTLPCM